MISWRSTAEGLPSQTSIAVWLKATEPGSMELEKRRHSQFEHLRVPSREEGSPRSRELFFPAPDLVEHVNGLRRNLGHPAIVTPSSVAPLGRFMASETADPVMIRGRRGAARGR